MKSEIAQKIIAIAPDALWAMFAVVLLVFLGIAGMLHYHWKHYGVSNDNRLFTRSLFWIVAVVLVITALMALTTFESNI